MALVSSAEMVAWFNVGNSVAPATLVAAEERSVEWLERMTGRPLNLDNAHEFKMRGPGGYELLLPFPRKPGGTIAIEERWGIGDDFVAVAASGYEVIDDPIRNTELVLRTDALWPRGEWLIKVTMQVGYDDGTCPDDLKRAVFRLVAFDLQGRFLTYDEATSDRRQSTSKLSEMPWDVQATVSRYRRLDWRARMRRAV